LGVLVLLAVANQPTEVAPQTGQADPLVPSQPPNFPAAIFSALDFLAIFSTSLGNLRSLKKEKGNHPMAGKPPPGGTKFP
jgi:hypothetical protein